MKKFIFGVVYVFLVFSSLSVSAQSIDLSSFSYSELQNIVAQVQNEMMKRPEFQSVEVPIGIYQVGVEIPAGKWTITKSNSAWMAEVDTGSALEEDKNGVDLWGGGYNSALLSDENPTQTVNFVDGYYVEVSMGAVVFSTPTGPSFSFN